MLVVALRYMCFDKTLYISAAGQILRIYGDQCHPVKLRYPSILERALGTSCKQVVNKGLLEKQKHSTGLETKQLTPPRHIS